MKTMLIVKPPVAPVPFTPARAKIAGPTVVKPAPQKGEVDAVEVANTLDAQRFSEMVRRANEDARKHR